MHRTAKRLFWPHGCMIQVILKAAKDMRKKVVPLPRISAPASGSAFGLGQAKPQEPAFDPSELPSLDKYLRG